MSVRSWRICNPSKNRPLTGNPIRSQDENAIQGTTEAPPFASIASRPGFDSNRLAFFVLEPHPKMPDMSLTRIEAGDIAAYIASLAK